MKEKRVGRIEFFYDLVFVYVISRMAALINAPINGVIEWNMLVRYGILVGVILQVWIYMIRYISVFGIHSLKERSVLVIHMISALFVAGTVSVDWTHMSMTFNSCVLIDFVSLFYLYRRQWELHKRSGWIVFSMIIVALIGIVYMLAMVCAGLGVHIPVIGLNVLALLIGIFVPMRMQKGKKRNRHATLLDHFHWFTMITFGQGVLAMAPYFSGNNFLLTPLFAFGSVFLGFCCYGIVMDLVRSDVDHHERGLIFNQCVILLGINVFTIGLRLIHDGTLAQDYLSYLIAGSLLLFYLGLLLHGRYYREEVRVRSRDALQMGLIALAGSLCILLLDYSSYGIWTGIVIIQAGFYYVFHRIRFLSQFQ